MLKMYSKTRIEAAWRKTGIRYQECFTIKNTIKIMNKINKDLENNKININHKHKIHIIIINKIKCKNKCQIHNNIHNNNILIINIINKNKLCHYKIIKININNLTECRVLFYIKIHILNYRKNILPIESLIQIKNFILTKDKVNCSTIITNLDKIIFNEFNKILHPFQSINNLIIILKMIKSNWIDKDWIHQHQHLAYKHTVMFLDHLFIQVHPITAKQNLLIIISFSHLKFKLLRLTLIRSVLFQAKKLKQLDFKTMNKIKKIWH